MYYYQFNMGGNSVYEYATISEAIYAIANDQIDNFTQWGLIQQVVDIYKLNDDGEVVQEYNCAMVDAFNNDVAIEVKSIAEEAKNQADHERSLYWGRV